MEEFTRIYASEGDKLVKKGNEYIDEQHIAYVDSTFLTYSLCRHFLAIPGMRLTNKYGGDNSVNSNKNILARQNALGKALEIDKKPYKITAVIKDIPQNSHFHFDFMLSMKNVDYGLVIFSVTTFKPICSAKARYGLRL